MPAIQLAKLKKQVAELSDLFHEPAALRSKLHKTLDEYADRTRRHGQSGEPPPLVITHNVPAPVLHQIIRELSIQAASNPESGLRLCDYLWKQPYLEENLIAVYLLGSIILADDQPILERIQEWLHSKPEERLVNAILEHSLANLRQNSPKVVIDLIEKWIVDADTYHKSLGLRECLYLIDQHSFNDLSLVFNWINPLIRFSPSEIRSDVINILIALARRTPQETAYTLRRILDSPENNHAAWYIRQTLKYFPAPTQSKLRTVLHEERYL
ncbi:MAG: DNA alkylation repair protein [Anaerolineales bacterium]|nr:MAG: DNA alkylation repair protein [Anaerolineales bacterium]